jgi:hypothetical protein
MTARTAIGTVNAAEFFVTLTVLTAFVSGLPMASQKQIITERPMTVRTSCQVGARSAEG